MQSTARDFIRACDREGIKYKDPRTTDSGKTAVTLGVTGSHGNSYNVGFYFDTNETGVAIRVYQFTACNDSNYARMLLACNELNNKYRWVKFVIDDDRDINIEADCVVSPSTAGTVCVEMFYHFMGIAKEAYPVLMRAQWGG